MSENASTNGWTCHVDIHYHYIRDFIEEGFLNVVFVRTKENIADGFTKNINNKIYHMHSKKYLEEMPKGN